MNKKEGIKLCESELKVMELENKDVDLVMRTLSGL